ncbi:MAG: replication initiator protein A [Desulfobacterales bacterium]
MTTSKCNKSQFIRQNKNFLNHPMFAIDEITANQEEKHCWSPVKGFRLETDYKLPTKTDQVVLYFFMLRSQELGWQPELVFSKHEILKNCSIPVSKKSYERLQDTLERWFQIRVYFQDSFVCAEKGKTHKVSGAFHILDAYDSHQEKSAGRSKIHIRISPSWLNVVRSHAFFEMLDFRAITNISSPLSLRLYEILSKNFYQRESWKIDALKLAAMIPLQVKYASLCINKIKPLISQINKACGGEVYFLEVKKPVRGVAILHFRKNQKAASLIPESPFPGLPAPVPGASPAGEAKAMPIPLFSESQDNDFDAMDFFNSLSEEEQKTLLTDFEASLNTYNLNRYKTKGLKGVKIPFAGFCAGYEVKK